MPWKETCTMEQREAFIDAWLSREFSVSELCERFSISRPTGYKFIARFRAEGRNGLADRSRAPHSHPNMTPLALQETILTLKRRHPSWGPITLHDRLVRRQPEHHWPAASTIGTLLERHGLVKPRERRQRTPPHTQPFAAINAPNDVWSADFKGQFLLGDSRLCYPFTLSDNYSRYLLCCQALYGPGMADTWTCLERALREYGLPLAIRTDNGVPFAGVSVGGLSLLAVRLLKLGIMPERTRPGRPQQNGRHERMHRTLKETAVSPPKANRSAQQRAFNHFRREYNDERPHRAWGKGLGPGDWYQPSPRPYPTRPPEVVYPDAFQTRSIRSDGSFQWRGQLLYLAQVLAGERIGLKELEHDRYEIYFAQLPLAVFDARTMTIIRPK